MFVINYDTLNGNIIINDNYVLNPTFSNIGDTYALSFINLKNVKYFKSLNYTISGNTDNRYLISEYRVSKDNNYWTPWNSITTDINIGSTNSSCTGYINNFIPFDPSYNMFIDIRWTRAGDSNIGVISLLDYILSGSLDKNLTDGLSIIYLNDTNRQIIIKPPYIFKIFKITDIEILSSGDINNTVISYRYSQDNGRTISNWTILTKENLRSERINPIRFFQIEYNVEYNGNDFVKIFDINIIGDFQNISLDSLKTNLLFYNNFILSKY